MISDATTSNLVYTNRRETACKAGFTLAFIEICIFAYALVVAPMVAYLMAPLLPPLTRSNKVAPSLVLIYQLAKIGKTGIFRNYQNKIHCRYTVASGHMPKIFAITFDITNYFRRN
jgi:hypothetical protein